MNDNKRYSASTEASKRYTVLLTVISVVVGVIVLWATWVFYGDSLDNPDFPWYRWIQPALQAIGGAMCLAAAILLLMRKPAGRDLLRAAIGIIPLILVLRLIIVAIRFVIKAVRWIYEGAIMEQLHVNPGIIAINAAVVAAVITLAMLGKKAKSAQAAKEEQDDR